MDSNIIIGVYDGYKELKTSKGGLHYFLKSLRQYNKTCKIFIVCQQQNRFAELEDICFQYDCVLYSDFATKYEMMYYRFEIYQKIINEQNPSSIHKILLSDLNDVIFQADPFEIDFQEELYCACECSMLGDETNCSSTLNMDWIRDCANAVSINMETIKDKYVVCAGTILGNIMGIQKYLDFYIRVQNASNPKKNDQGLLNTYVHSVLESKRTEHYSCSRILTLDKILFHSLNCMDNTIYNEENEVYAIIHQIDRCNLPYMKYIVDILP
jgi:hypothetical protein